MSLINQMLKELDARRSDASGGSPFGSQIRAVPDRRRIHPAWWLALALALSLVAVVVWVLLRPPAADPYMMRAQLPLKLDVDIGRAVEAAPFPPATPVAPAALAPIAAIEPAATAEPVAADNTAAPEPAVPVPDPLVVAAAPTVPLAPVAVAAPASTVKPAPSMQNMKEDRKPAVVVAAVTETEADEAESRRPITKQVRELTPQQRAENEFRRATLAMQQGQRLDARAGFEQALQIDARHSGARQALIAVLLDARRNEEAMRHAREGLELDPRQAGWAMILARLQLEKNDLQGAIDTLERTRSHAVERADYLAFLAALLQRDGRHKEAAEQYVLALRQVPHNGVWWMGLGISLQAEQRNAEASEAFKRAKASNSLSPELLAFVDARLAQLK